MVIQHIFPVFFMLLLGAVLRRRGITSEVFLKNSDRLVYYIFFPLLLFWKIGGAGQPFTPETLRFYLAVACTVALLYLVSLAVIRIGSIPAHQAGAFSQCCYRFNTYVGMAVVSSVLGEAGAARFGVLIGMIIPVINVLAVSTLIWFSPRPDGGRSRNNAVLLKSIITNPLIIGCAAGLLYARIINVFPPFIDNTLSLSASVTLPLALLSIGGNLTLKEIKKHFCTALTAAVLKLAALPLAGFLIMGWWSVDGLFFQVGMIFFALPASTSIYVLSAQLNSDTELASASIALSTLASFFSLSAVLGWVHG